MSIEIREFHGRYRFLSNFYPCSIKVEDIEFPSVEHAFQAMKTLNPRIRRNIALLPTPGKAKQFGRVLQLREDWDTVRYPIMMELVRQKFTRYGDLAVMLLDTYPAKLVEGNYWNDTYWGVCNGVGENKLGEILMLVRKELGKGKDAKWNYKTHHEI